MILTYLFSCKKRSFVRLLVTLAVFATLNSCGEPSVQEDDLFSVGKQWDALSLQLLAEQYGHADLSTDADSRKAIRVSLQDVPHDLQYAFIEMYAGNTQVLNTMTEDDFRSMLPAALKLERIGILPLGASWNEPEDTEVAIAPATDGLPDCGGFWGNNWVGSAKAPYEGEVSKFYFYWSPNCSMVAPGDSCGTDHDDDMVSFFLGPDYTLDYSKYRVHATSYWLRQYLRYISKGGSFRLYLNDSYGRMYGDAYVCVPYEFDARTLRFGTVK